MSASPGEVSPAAGFPLFEMRLARQGKPGRNSWLALDTIHGYLSFFKKRIRVCPNASIFSCLGICRNQLGYSSWWRWLEMEPMDKSTRLVGGSVACFHTHTRAHTHTHMGLRAHQGCCFTTEEEEEEEEGVLAGHRSSGRCRT